MAGGWALAAKQDEHQPHPEEKAMVIQTLLFVVGLNTLAQSFFGTCLPAVMGGSFTFVLTTLSIILATRYNNVVDPVEKFRKIMRGIQGALIVASTLQILLGFSGLWCNVTRLPNVWKLDCLGSFFCYFSHRGTNMGVLFLASGLPLLYRGGMFMSHSTGTGFQHKGSYLVGRSSMQIKMIPGDSAGIVTAFYEANMGTMTTFGILYVSFTMFSLVASSIVSSLGSKNDLILDTTGYWLYIAANLKPSR